jgi:hypothetical protein
MSFLLASLVVSLASCQGDSWWAPRPSKSDIRVMHLLEDADIIPWPHGFNQPLPRRNLSPAELKALGQQFFPNVSAAVNATVLAEVIYTWSQPTYRQFQFPLTARPQNNTVLGALITYMPVNSNPWVPAMFNLTGATPAAVLAQLANQSDAVWANAQTEIGVLQYALSQLPSISYNDAPVLFRGGARNSAWFCNQFSLDFDFSIDECMAAYFNPNSKISVATFWSTTTNPSVSRGYKGAVLYYILPGPFRTSWHARNITTINVDTSNLEVLYPAWSTFTVQNISCVGAAPYGYWNVTLLENGPGKPNSASKPSGQRPFARCTA